MIRINLLPEYRRKSEFPTWKLYRIIAYVFLGLSILLWGYHLAMFKYTESKLSDVNEGIVSMKVWQERFDKAQQQNAEVNKRNTIVRNLSKDRIVWSRSLAELGNVTPYGCWLTSVKQGNKPDQMSIAGKAMKMDDIVKFISLLQARPDIANVQLISADESNNNNSSTAGVIDFTLEIQSENSKYSLLLLGSVLLLVFVVLYIMQPLREDIQKNEQELTQAQQRLASYQTFAEQNKDYNAFAAKQEGYLAEAKKLLPDIVTVPELVQEYSNLSKECGIQFKSVKPPSGNLKQVNGAYEVPLNISISGNYYKMVEFLQKVENGTRFAKLNKASVNTVKENDASGNLDMTAEFTVYSLKDALGKMNTGAAGEKTGLDRVKERDAANMAAIDEAKK